VAALARQPHRRFMHRVDQLTENRACSSPLSCSHGSIACRIENTTSASRLCFAMSGILSISFTMTSAAGKGARTADLDAWLTSRYGGPAEVRAAGPHGPSRLHGVTIIPGRLAF